MNIYVFVYYFPRNLKKELLANIVDINFKSFTFHKYLYKSNLYLYKFIGKIYFLYKKIIEI